MGWGNILHLMACRMWVWGFAYFNYLFFWTNSYFNYLNENFSIIGHQKGKDYKGWHLFLVFFFFWTTCFLFLYMFIRTLSSPYLVFLPIFFHVTHLSNHFMCAMWHYYWYFLYSHKLYFCKKGYQEIHDILQNI